MSQNESVSSQYPREGSIIYGFMTGTKESRKKAVSKFKIMNKYFIVPLYRFNILPLFFVGRFFVLLYIKGRKSGKQRITPVEFRNYNDYILLFSSRGTHGDWYRNIMANPSDLIIKKGFSKFKPSSVSNCDYNEKIEILTWYTNKYPKYAKEFYGYDKKTDTVSEDLLKPVADFMEILKLKK